MDLATRAYFLGWAAVKKLPAPLARGLFAAAGTLAGDILDRQGKLTRLRTNLGKVLGQEPASVPRSLLRASMRSYARYWMEAFRLPSLAASHRLPALLSDIEHSIDGREYLEDSLAQGRGVVLVLPHSGNWDMAGLWLAQRCGTFATVAERLKPEALFDAFVAYRESLGFTVFPHKGGPRPALDELRDVLAAGGVICLVGERDLSEHGIPVEFFGQRSTMPRGAAQLAREFDVPLHAVHCWFTPRGWGFSVSAPIPTSGTLDAVVQRQAEHFERNIAAHPADWHMLQTMWK